MHKYLATYCYESNNTENIGFDKKNKNTQNKNKTRANKKNKLENQNQGKNKKQRKKQNKKKSKKNVFFFYFFAKIHFLCSTRGHKPTGPQDKHTFWWLNMQW